MAACAAAAVYVEAMSLYLVQEPVAINVVVDENQSGDILSDLGGAAGSSDATGAMIEAL